jgi:hypothetical protein
MPIVIIPKISTPIPTYNIPISLFGAETLCPIADAKKPRLINTAERGKEILTVHTPCFEKGK